MTTSIEAQRPAKRRTWPWVAVAALLVAAIAATIFVALRNPASGEDTAGRGPVQAQTATVTRTDLSDRRTLTGDLGYGPTREVMDNSGGIVTWLPEPGAKMSRGDTLYRVDDQAIPVFYGTTPLFRPLDEPGLVGRDVRVVADNLAALGYAIGEQPSVGSRIPQPDPQPDPQPESPDRQPGGSGETGKPSSGSGGRASDNAEQAADSGDTGGRPSGGAVSGGARQDASGNETPQYAVVHKGDAVLTPALIDAIGRWQSDVGLPSTGTLGPDSVAVLRGESRVASVSAQPGTLASGPVLAVSSLKKSVTVPMNATDVGTISVDDQVSITLPDGGTVSGTVTGISGTARQEQPAAMESGGGGEQQRDVVITLDDPSAAGGLDHATVRVTFTGDSRSNVLAVPVDALLALSEGGYALQKPGGKLVPVETGLFAKGMVEVSGEGVHAGMRVVTAS